MKKVHKHAEKIMHHAHKMMEEMGKHDEMTAKHEKKHEIKGKKMGKDVRKTRSYGKKK